MSTDLGTLREARGVGLEELRTHADVRMALREDSKLDPNGLIGLSQVAAARLESADALERIEWLQVLELIVEAAADDEVRANLVQRYLACAARVAIGTGSPGQVAEVAGRAVGELCALGPQRHEDVQDLAERWRAAADHAIRTSMRPELVQWRRVTSLLNAVASLESHLGDTPPECELGAWLAVVRTIP